MNGWLKTLVDDRGHISEHNEYGSWVSYGIRQGMEPFRLKQIDILMDFDIDFNEYRILGAAVLMSGYTISYSSRVNACNLADYPGREMARVAKEMKEAFRNRMDWPLPPLVYLGEN